MSHHAVDDMGLGTSELGDILDAFNWVMDTAYATILHRGKFTWNQFWNAGSTCCIGCPDPMVKQDSCAKDVRSLCAKDSYAQKYAMLYGFSPGCGGSTSNLTDPDTDIAAFLLTRGGHAWLGHGWSGCSKVYERTAALDQDYGVPLDLCSETAPGSQVFTREWSKSTITLDCNTWKGTIVLKDEADI